MNTSPAFVPTLSVTTSSASAFINDISTSSIRPSRRYSPCKTIRLAPKSNPYCRTEASTASAPVSAPAVPLPPPTNVKSITVETATGKRIQPLLNRDTPRTTIFKAEISLTAETSTVLGIETKDIRQADIYSPASKPLSKNSTDNYLDNARLIVFAHGFSQLPRNYSSTLQYLAARGYTVIAPRVWIGDVLLNSTCSLLCRGVRGMQVDIQTALAVDVARTAELAAMHNVHSTTLLGHSMGGGTVFQYAQYGDKLPMQPASVIGMAPYFKGMKLSDVNEYVKLHWLKIRDGNLETLGNIMKDVPTLLIQGSNDLITHEKDTQRVFEGLTRDEKEAITGMATIEHGWHIGFEDRLAVDLGDFLSLPTALGIDLFFFIVDFLLYREDALNLNTNEQLQTTKVLLDQWLSTVGEPASEVVEDMENQETESKVIFQWADVE